MIILDEKCVTFLAEQRIRSARSVRENRFERELNRFEVRKVDDDNNNSVEQVDDNNSVEKGLFACNVR
jgi:hypothetical protein